MRTLIIGACLVTTAESFAIPSCKHSPCSALHLVPSQADQLVAASTLVYKQDTDDDGDAEHIFDDTIHNDQDTATQDGTKQQQQQHEAHSSFVSRVFSLPSSLLHPHRTENEVLYPVVGFHYVDDGQDGWRAFPTVSTAACRLPPHHEETYGWYSAPEQQ